MKAMPDRLIDCIAYIHTGNIHKKAKHAIDKRKILDSWRDFKDYVSINQEA